MKDILISLFGTYTPITYLDTNGNELIASGFAGVDWTYVLGVLLFGVCLYSFFRILGSIISRF